MAEKSYKSRFTQKQSDKDEKPSPDKMRLLKYEDIVLKLKQAVEKNKDYKTSHKDSSNQKINNKTNYSNPTTSRMKEDIGDREFLSNCWNTDEQTNILPKNMHLLIDNDTNQSISSQEKYKNLSNLMLDDKNITEFNFIRNPEERIKLHLYTAFSKKSRELFMNENHPKRSKNQTLLHKINDIHIPKFEFKQSNLQNNANKNNSYNFIDNSDINFEKSEASESACFNMNKKNNNEDEEKNENENEKEKPNFKECYFRQEKKGYFHIPSLVKIESKPAMKAELRKQKTYIGPAKMFNPFKKEIKKQDDIFWDPEIDADTLSYINHNFISIEDIYNNKNIDDKKIKNQKIQNDDIEPNIIPIQAKELCFNRERKSTLNNFVFEKEKKNEIEHVDNDKLKNENQNDNKFIEFIAINPGVIKSEYEVVPKAKADLNYELNLKKDFREKINKVSEYDLNIFPKNGDYSPKKIERVLRFHKLVKESKEIEISIKPKSSTNDDSQNTIKESNEENEIKIGSMTNFKKSFKFKDKSFSNIDEKKSDMYNDEEDFEQTPKIIDSVNSQNNITQTNKYEEKKSVFNFNDDDNDNSERTPFSSEKS